MKYIIKSILLSLFLSGVQGQGVWVDSSDRMSFVVCGPVHPS